MLRERQYLWKVVEREEEVAKQCQSIANSQCSSPLCTLPPLSPFRGMSVVAVQWYLSPVPSSIRVEHTLEFTFSSPLSPSPSLPLTVLLALLTHHHLSFAAVNSKQQQHCHYETKSKTGFAKEPKHSKRTDGVSNGCNFERQSKLRCRDARTHQDRSRQEARKNKVAVR